MARIYPIQNDAPEGIIDFLEIKPKVFHVYFTPAPELLVRKKEDPLIYRTRIMEIDYPAKTLKFTPFKVGGFKSISARYKKLLVIQIDFQNFHIPESFQDINLDDVIQESFPEIFTVNYNWGLGVQKVYRPIVSMLEDQGIHTWIITRSGKSEIDPAAGVARITESDLNEMKNTIKKINERTQRVAATLKREALQKQLRHLIYDVPILKDLTFPLIDDLKNAISPLDKVNRKDRKNAIQLIRSNGKKIAQEEPDQLLKLRNDIDLVTLEELITKMENLLNKPSKELQWQTLFEQNPFILSMVLGIPVIKVQGQAFVGGRKISGSGEKIADFLMKNPGTNNTAIVEIKTPAMPLLSSRNFKEDLFAPSTKLVEAINQTLEQIYQFQKNIAFLRSNDPQIQLETYAVSGVIIAGKNPNLLVEQKSWELFRGNSKNIQILTFDELLGKLKTLHGFLAGDPVIDGTRTIPSPQTFDESELPF